MNQEEKQQFDNLKQELGLSQLNQNRRNNEVNTRLAKLETFFESLSLTIRSVGTSAAEAKADVASLEKGLAAFRDTHNKALVALEKGTTNALAPIAERIAALEKAADKPKRRTWLGAGKRKRRSGR